MTPDDHVFTQPFWKQQGTAQHLKHLEEVLGICDSVMGTPLARGKVGIHSLEIN